MPTQIVCLALNAFVSNNAHSLVCS